MVSKTKAIKDVLKQEWEEVKDFLTQPLMIKKRYKKSIQKQQRSESRIAQRTGNKYMIGKKTTRVKQKGKIQKARPRGGWKAEG